MTEPIHARARKFLQEFFNDDELDTFCLDHFFEVYNNFTLGMPKSQKVGMLISYSQRKEQFDKLLAALERERPNLYNRHFSASQKWENKLEKRVGFLRLRHMIPNWVWVVGLIIVLTSAIYVIIWSNIKVEPPQEPTATLPGKLDFEPIDSPTMTPVSFLTCKDGQIEYIVEAGDTLFKIEQVYDTTVNVLMSNNGLTSHTLRVGQVLLIPCK